MHTHVYHKATSLSVDPGFIARRPPAPRWSMPAAGAGNYDGLRDYVMANSPLPHLRLPQHLVPGIFGFDKDVSIGEATLRSMLPVHRCVDKIEDNRDRIIGVGSASAASSPAISASERLKLAPRPPIAEVQLPLMTHIGFPPPTYSDVVDMLRPGDILTIASGAQFGDRRGRQGAGRPLACPERGVLFDIAHGMGAFGWRQHRGGAARWLQARPHLLGRACDRHRGPRYDMLHTMSKLLNCGLSLSDVIDMSTSRPALAIGRPELGHLGVGAVADITVLEQVDSSYVFSGRRRHQAPGSSLLQPVAVYLGDATWKSAVGPSRKPSFPQPPPSVRRP